MTRDEFLAMYCCENPYKEQGRIEVHIRDNAELTEIPDCLIACDVLDIENCPNLCKLPNKLSVDFLFIKDCPKLTELPKNIQVDAMLQWDKESGEN